MSMIGPSSSWLAKFLGKVKFTMRASAPSRIRVLAKEVLEFLEGLTVVSVLSAVAQKTSGGTFYVLTALTLGGLIALWTWCGVLVFRFIPKVEGGKPVAQVIISGVCSAAFVGLVLYVIPRAILFAIADLAKAPDVALH